MGLREWVTQRPAAGVVVVILALAIAVVMIVRSFQPRGVQLANQVYYFDLGSGDLFPAPTSMYPIDGPQGGTGKGVRASVFSCGGCDASQRVVGYLTTYTEEAIGVLKNPPSAEQDPTGVLVSTARERGELIALPPAAGQPAQWLPRNSPQGRAIAQQYDQLCDGQPARACLPQ